MVEIKNIINNILENNDKGFLVITREDGGFFLKYDKNSPYQFYTHHEKTYGEALKSQEYFRKKGVHAIIVRNFLNLDKKLLSK